MFGCDLGSADTTWTRREDQVRSVVRGKNRTTTSARRVLLVSFKPVPQPDTVRASHIMYKSSWANLAVLSLSFIYFWVAILTTNTRPKHGENRSYCILTSRPTRLVRSYTTSGHRLFIVYNVAIKLDKSGCRVFIVYLLLGRILTRAQWVRQYAK